MTIRGFKWAVPGAVVVVCLSLAGVRLIAGPCNEKRPCEAKAADKAPPCCPAQAHADAALKAINAARKAVKAGNKDLAIAELDKAGKLVVSVRDALAKCPMSAAGRKIVNARCPMMGGKVDANKIADSLTRVYKGQKVGFCCAGCPNAWDKLSDAERDEKLKKAQGDK